MAFTTIDTNNLLPGEPWTSAKALGVYENVFATAYGETDAPVNFTGWHPYDSLIVGDGNDGLIYDSSVDGTGNQVSPTFEDGFEYAFRMVNTTVTSIVLNPAAGVPATADTFNDSNIYGMFSVLHPRIPMRLHGISFLTAIFGTTGELGAAGGGSSGGTAYTVSPQKVNSLTLTGVSGPGAKIYMYRRRDYTSD